MTLAKTEKERVNYCDKLLELSEKPNITKIRLHFVRTQLKQRLWKVLDLEILLRGKNGFKIFHIKNKCFYADENVF